MGAEREDVPWVKYNAAAALAQLTTVSPAAELAHRRLCDYHWQTGLWPLVPQGLLALCRIKPAAWPRVKNELLRLGWRPGRGSLSHPGVHRVRAEAATAVGRAQRKARNAARQRWAGAKAPTASPRPGGPPGDGTDAPGMHGALLDALPEALPDAVHDAVPDAMQDAMQKDSKSNSKSKKESKIFTAVNNEQLLRTGSLHEKSALGEKRFMADLLEAYALWNPEWASRELEEWGGWWRNRVRENADKARRVLADIRSMIRERKIMQDPGKAAYDLWNRLP